MGKVKLPSGKIAKVPDGLSRNQVMELLFEKLPDGEDKDYFGSQLDTSGWGATIGGGLGSIAGTAAGFLAGGIGAIPGSVAGGGAGAALGEGVEQWWTGKGDAGDIARAGGEGALWGLVPGVGGQAAKTAGRLGARGAGKALAGLGTNVGIGAGIGAGGATVVGGDPKVGAGIGAAGGLLSGAKLPGKAGEFVEGAIQESVGKVSKHLGLNREVETLFQALEGPAKEYASGQFKTLSGRRAAGGLQKAGAIWDVKRNLTAYLAGKAKKAWAGKVTPKVEKKLEAEAAKRADDIIDELDFIPDEHFLDPSTKIIKEGLGPHPKDYFEDAEGAVYDLFEDVTRKKPKGTPTTYRKMVKAPTKKSPAEYVDAPAIKMKEGLIVDVKTGEIVGGKLDKDLQRQLDKISLERLKLDPSSARWKELDKLYNELHPYPDAPMSFAKGGKVGLLKLAKGGKALDNKVSKIYKEGYTAPGQAYAIAKSMGYAEGGPIKIKKKNRGKFTASAKRAGMSVPAYANKILSAPEGKYSGLLRKRANFARNASKWG